MSRFVTTFLSREEFEQATTGMTSLAFFSDVHGNASALAAVLVFGHTHVPWHRRHGDVLFVNAGSAGRPKDGDTRAGYTLLQLPTDGAPEVTVVRVPYDVETTVAGVLAAGLPPALADAFRSGA